MYKLKCAYFVNMLFLLFMSIGFSKNVNANTFNNSTELDLEKFKFPANLSIDANFDTTFYKDIPYGDSTFSKLDYFRRNDINNAPLVIYVHGGNFIGGDKSSSNVEKDINKFLTAGVNFITVNYTLLDIDGIDSEGIKKSMSDVVTALQFVRLNAAEFSIDSDSIAIYGESTGANIALWLALSDDFADESSAELINKQSTKVRAVAAREAQASLDFVQWENSIFTGAGFQLELLTQSEFDWYLASFYGLSSTELANVPSVLRSDDSAISSYRQSIDVLNLLDAEDPAIYMSNTKAPFDLSTLLSRGNSQEIIYALFHHQLHVAALYQAAAMAGVEFEPNAPNIGLQSPNFADAVSFLINRLQK